MELMYFPMVCRLLQIQPKLNHVALQVLERVEQHKGYVLPAAVRELVTIRGVRIGERSTLMILKQLLQQLRRLPHRTAARTPPRLSLALPDTEPDPHVLVLDLDGEANPELRQATKDSYWNLVSLGVRVTEYFHDTIWRHHITSRRYSWTVRDEEIGPPHLDFLSERFELYSCNSHADDGVDWWVTRYLTSACTIELRTVGNPCQEFTHGCWILTSHNETELRRLIEYCALIHIVPVTIHRHRHEDHLSQTKHFHK